MAQATDLSKMSNVEKYKKRVASAYGKDRPKFYERGLAVAEGLDAKQSPKKKTRKRVAAKTSAK